MQMAPVSILETVSSVSLNPAGRQLDLQLLGDNTVSWPKFKLLQNNLAGLKHVVLHFSHQDNSNDQLAVTSSNSANSAAAGSRSGVLW